MKRSPWRLLVVGLSAILVAIAVDTRTARAAWGQMAERLTQLLSLHGNRQPASASVLSGNEIEALADMPPQQQAELLLERSINHSRGANDQIAARVNAWHGRIKLDDRLNNLT